MGKLIDADALPEHKFPENQCNKFGDGAYYRQGWNDAIDAIVDNEPPVDAVPVRHGRWIDETFKPWGLVHHPYKCDQCGDHSEAPSDYCPNCGADMRKDSDHHDD